MKALKNFIHGQKQIDYLRVNSSSRVIKVSTLTALLMIAVPVQADLTKADIDTYAKAKGFFDSNYPYYESVNACGSPKTAWIPDKYLLTIEVPSLTNLFRMETKVLFRADFGPACDKHDMCYMTLGSDRGRCESNFGSDLLDACYNPSIVDYLYLGGLEPMATCASLATTYVSTTVVAGEFIFPDSQKRAKEYKELVDGYIASYESSKILPIINSLLLE